MKTFVFSFLLLAFSSIGFSQDEPNDLSTLRLEGVTVSAINEDYLNDVLDEKTPSVVIDLHLQAANFDATSAPGFDKQNTRAYETVFQATNGRLLAAYGPKGQIIASHARFKDVVLPRSVRREAFLENEDWQMYGNTFVGTFAEDKAGKKRYKIELRKGSKSKNVTVRFD